MFAQGQAECRTVVVFGQGGLEIGGGDMVWTSLVSTPLDEEAIAQAQHHSEHQHGVVVANPAAVVVVGDIQALVQTALNAPMIPVQTQPVVASSREGSRLVISATNSSLRPSVWRKSRAACSANGKRTCSPVTGTVQILRLSWRRLLISCTRALVGVDSRGGKIALGSGNQCFDLCADGGLVPLDR